MSNIDQFFSNIHHHLVPLNNLSISGTAILAHPLSRKTKFLSSEGESVQIYLKNGFQVVFYNYNGFGESNRIDLFYWKDAKAVIDWVKMNNNHLPIILHGLSFGSFHIIRAISSLPNGGKVVLENASRSLYDYWKRWIHTAILVRLLKLLQLQAIRDMNALDSLSSLNNDSNPHAKDYIDYMNIVQRGWNYAIANYFMVMETIGGGI